MKLPELFGSYLLHQRTAMGTTSEVYRAQTTGEYPRQCALKRIHHQLAMTPGFPERFRRDAELLVRLVHGNLVQVLEVGEVNEQPFVAMEQIDGVEIGQLVESVASDGPLPVDFSLYVGLEMWRSGRVPVPPSAGGGERRHLRPRPAVAAGGNGLVRRGREDSRPRQLRRAPPGPAEGLASLSQPRLRHPRGDPQAAARPALGCLLRRRGAVGMPGRRAPGQRRPRGVRPQRALRRLASAGGRAPGRAGRHHPPRRRGAGAGPRPAPRLARGRPPAAGREPAAHHARLRIGRGLAAAVAAVPRRHRQRRGDGDARRAALADRSGEGTPRANADLWSRGAAPTARWSIRPR